MKSKQTTRKHEVNIDFSDNMFPSITMWGLWGSKRVICVSVRSGQLGSACYPNTLHEPIHKDEQPNVFTNLGPLWSTESHNALEPVHCLSKANRCSDPQCHLLNVETLNGYQAAGFLQPSGPRIALQGHVTKHFGGVACGQMRPVMWTLVLHEVPPYSTTIMTPCTLSNNSRRKPTNTHWAEICIFGTLCGSAAEYVHIQETRTGTR